MKQSLFSREIRAARNLLLFSAFLFSALVGCKSKTETVQEVEVSFNVGFEVVQEPIDAPAKAPMANEVKSLIIFEGTSELYNGTSLNPTVKLKSGAHTLTFVATYQDGATLTNGVWSANKNADTYGYVFAFNTADITTTQNITLSRVCYFLEWKSSDVIPQEGYKAYLTFGNYRSSLKEGLAGGEAINQEFNDVALTKDKNLKLNVSAFCAAYGVEETVTTTITIKDSHNNIVASFSKDVPVQTNRRTVIRGKMFGDEVSSLCTINEAWMPNDTIPL